MWKASAKETNFTHRLAQATISCLGPDGAALVDQQVKVEQVSHDVLFGNIASYIKNEKMKGRRKK